MFWIDNISLSDPTFNLEMNFSECTRKKPLDKVDIYH